MRRVRVSFAGAGEFGLPTLRALLAAHDVVQVISQPDRPAGRGRKLTPNSIAQFALEQNLPLLRTENINAETLEPCDAMVVIAFGQKISQAVANAPRLGSVNLHASLLPKCRGAAPIHWSIIRGETITGNSVIRLAETMDAGVILGQSQVRINEGETTGQLHDRLADDGATLVLQVLDELDRACAIERPQDHSQATAAPKLSRQDAQIDWKNSDASSIAARINGLSPWPGIHARLLSADGTPITRISLLSARAVQNNRGEPGKILEDGTIAGKVGAVEILSLQPEGKRAMRLEDFRNGHSWPVGGTVETLS